MDRTSSSRRSALTRVALSAVLVVLTAAAGAFGFHRSPKVGPYPSRGRPAPAISSVLPLFEDCGAAPQFQPRTLPSCQPCAAVIDALAWTAWTATRAEGTGERATPACRRRAGAPQHVHLTVVTVVLRDPKLETFCASTGPGRDADLSEVVFTEGNLVPSIVIPSGACPLHGDGAG